MVVVPGRGTVGRRLVVVLCLLRARSVIISCHAILVYREDFLLAA